VNNIANSDFVENLTPDIFQYFFNNAGIKKSNHEYILYNMLFTYTTVDSLKMKKGDISVCILITKFIIPMLVNSRNYALQDYLIFGKNKLAINFRKYNGI
jgi:hypothetical protein